MSTATVGKWGNTCALRIPQPYCKQLGWEPGQRVDLWVEGNRLMARGSDENYTIQSRLAAWDGKRFESAEYDWGEPAGEEIW